MVYRLLDTLYGWGAHLRSHLFQSERRGRMTRGYVALLILLWSVPAFAQDVKAVAVQARSKQPAVFLDHAQAAAVLRDTVLLLGKEWAFLRKDGGNNCDVGAAFRVSCDWVIHIPSNQGCDLFGDAPGYGSDGKPVRGTMQPAGCHLEPAPGPYVPVTSTPIPQPQPTPPPAPQPPAVDLTDILNRLSAAEARLDALTSRPPVLPLDVLLETLKRVYFECSVGRSAFHGHACVIAEPRAK
jgi:hypothetical protein